MRVALLFSALVLLNAGSLAAQERKTVEPIDLVNLEGVDSPGACSCISDASACTVV